MTEHKLYNESMKNCLLSASGNGAFWLIFLLIFCFFSVHTIRLAKIGWKYRKTSEEKTKSTPPEPIRKEQTPAPPQPERREAPPEPVYYIVERKRRKVKDSYSAPKEIKFK